LQAENFIWNLKKKLKSWKSVEPYKICWHTPGREFNKENKCKQLNRLKNKHTHAKTENSFWHSRASCFRGTFPFGRKNKL
jgi:hypothetical protein